ncbi:MAG: MerR family transcriptional regulator [Crocinitomicaceae bacterium]|nr:MerR family transcriptional regulator [Crocinitomicaceae bacterium]|tara:strand:+ start:3933 stop:4268 length:336 start_codon:yes stop_codon:yes gene_type:complete
MPLRKKEITRLFYSIGEVAEMFEVNTSLIRFWEKEFEIIQPKKNKKGNRLFTPKDVDHFQIIFRLVKHQGYTLEGAKKALKEQKTELANQNNLLNKLKSIKGELKQIQNEL